MLLVQSGQTRKPERALLCFCSLFPCHKCPVYLWKSRKMTRNLLQPPSLPNLNHFFFLENKGQFCLIYIITLHIDGKRKWTLMISWFFFSRGTGCLLTLINPIIWYTSIFSDSLLVPRHSIDLQNISTISSRVIILKNYSLRLLYVYTNVFKNIHTHFKHFSCFIQSCISCFFGIFYQDFYMSMESYWNDLSNNIPP